MTKIIPISEITDHQQEIVEIFRSGGVVLYPTDTQYGLGAVARNRAAVEKVIAVKQASESKAVSVIVPDIATAEKLVYVPDEARKLMEQHLPGALTLVLPARDVELSAACGNVAEIGIRIPNCPEILELVQVLGEPITTTSANISGQAPATNCVDILKTLVGIDVAIDAGELNHPASTIVRFSGSGFELLRQGAVVV